MLEVVVPHFNIFTVRCSDYSFIFRFSSQSKKRRTFELGGITKTVFPNHGDIFTDFGICLILT